MNNKHLPIKAQDTTVLAFKGTTGKQTQLAVSQLPEDLQFEVKLMDDMKQRQFDAYHAFNRARLALLAQQNQVQALLNNFIEQQNNEAMENDTDNK